MTDVAEVNVVWEIDAMRAALGLLLNLLRIGFILDLILLVSWPFLLHY
jgi:hypothetical protein